MDDLSALQFHDHKDIPGSKQSIIHHGKITGPDVMNMILQEGGPGLSRCLRFFDFRHVFLDGAFADFDAQL